MRKLFLMFVMFLGVLVSAQTFQIGISGNNPILFGDITETDLNNPSAGYVMSANGSNFDFMYYTPKNWGFGFRANYTAYIKDIDLYKEDLLNNLGITDTSMIMQSLYTYRYFGFQIGASHNFKIKGKFNIEPYLFFGAGAFISPMEEATYFKGGQTFTRKKTVTGFASVNYSPGVKFQWNLVDGHLGLSLYIEYNGIALESWEEETVTYTANSFNKTSNTKSYNISAVNIGGGISYRFGNGLNE